MPLAGLERQMESKKYSKYIVTQPKLVTELAYHDFSKISGFTFPDEVYLDKDILKEANQWLDIMWIWEIPNPRNLPESHSHQFDEVVLLIGSDPRNLRDLGGEIEWTTGNGQDSEKYVITSTCLIYVPKGLIHGPMSFNRVDRPILNVAIGLNTKNYA
jgi:hypothetical protein